MGAILDILLRYVLEQAAALSPCFSEVRSRQAGPMKYCTSCKTRRSEPGLQLAWLANGPSGPRISRETSRIHDIFRLPRNTRSFVNVFLFSAQRRLGAGSNCPIRFL